MLKFTGIFTFIIYLVNCSAQHLPYRLSFGLNNSYSYGYFYSGTTLETGDPNIEFSNFKTVHMESKSSLDWSNELSGMSFFESLGRRHHINFGLEYFINKNTSLSIGYELGSRNFSINADDRIIAFRNIRTHSLPILLSHYNKLYKNIFLKRSTGFSLNIPISKNQKSFPVNTYETRAYSPIYFLINLGTDIDLS